MRDYQEYDINYFQDEDGMFTAEVPAIRGCLAWGKTLPEAYRNAIDAIESCLEARAKVSAELTNSQIRTLKAKAQRLKATVKVGKEGLSPKFIAALDETLKHNELLKVKFDDFKEQKNELAPELAEKTGSHLVTRVGNVVVLYRPKLEENKPID